MHQTKQKYKTEISFRELKTVINCHKTKTGVWSDRIPACRETETENKINNLPYLYGA